MSDPPPPQPLPYYSFQGQYSHIAPRRPTSVSVIGWIAAILGGLMLVGGMCGMLVMSSMSGSPAFAANPVLNAMNSNPAFKAFNTIMQIVGLFVSLLVMVAGIASLNLKPWARKLMIGLAVYYSIAIVVGTIVSFLVVTPAMTQAMVNQTPALPGSSMPRAFFAISSIFTLVLYWACAFIVIFFYTRPNVKAAFEDTPPPLPPAMPPPPLPPAMPPPPR
jgi:hypothetical protein